MFDAARKTAEAFRVNSATKDDVYDEKVRSIMLTGKFGTRDWTGQNFYDEHPKGSESWSSYMSEKTRSAKARFRENWARTHYTQVYEERKHKKHGGP